MKKKTIKWCKKNKKIIGIGVVCFTLIMLLGVAAYSQGKTDAKYEYEQLAKQKLEKETFKLFLEAPYETAKEIFLKTIMFKFMVWLKPILIILAIGYILRSITGGGIF